MQRQDYIEKIAAYIVEDWNAADAGDQQACSAAKRFKYRSGSCRDTWSFSRLLACRVAIPSGGPVLDLIAGEAPPYRPGGCLFSLTVSINQGLDDIAGHTRCFAYLEEGRF